MNKLLGMGRALRVYGNADVVREEGVLKLLLLDEPEGEQELFLQPSLDGSIPGHQSKS